MKKSRIYHPFYKWEEVEYNMWGKTKNKENAISLLVIFMSDIEQFEKWMKAVCKDWKYSCEHNLSNTSSNRVAWLGQASCAYKFKYSEDIVRTSWFLISEKSRNLANEAAKLAIIEWEGKTWQS